MKKIVLCCIVLALLVSPVAVFAKDQATTSYNGEESLDKAATSSVSCDITYELDGGSNHSANRSHITKTLSLKKPAKTGFTFIGWYRDAEFTRKVTKVYPSWGEVTLYARWSENYYKIMYSTGVKSIKFPTQTVHYTDTVSLNEIDVNARRGYTFTGWKKTVKKTATYYDNGAEVSKLSSKNKSKVKLTAVWTPITYSITYDMDGGATNNPTTYNITRKINLKSAYKSDYKFLGWYTTPEFTGKPVKTISKGRTGNITLYAKWQKLLPDVAPVPVEDDTLLSQRYKVIAITNAKRKAAGLPELAANSELMDYAQIRANDIITEFSHARPGGESTFTAFAEMYGHPGFMIGENIAKFQTSPENVMNSWMNSSGHKTNILNKEARNIGVGCVKKDGRYYWVQVFGNITSLPPI